MRKALVAIVVTLSCLFFLPLTPAAAMQNGGGGRRPHHPGPHYRDFDD